MDLALDKYEEEQSQEVPGDITPGKYSERELGVFTAVATAYSPPNRNSIAVSELEDAAADSGVWWGVGVGE